MDYNCNSNIGLYILVTNITSKEVIFKMKKKHILYSHSDKCLNRNSFNRYIYNDPTLNTSSIEISDIDETISTAYFPHHYGPTYLTETMENSDADEFQMQGPTTYTFSIENSDDDEFIASSQMNNKSEDFDDILLL